MILINSLNDIPEEEGFVVTTTYNYQKLVSSPNILEDLKDFVADNVLLKKSDIAKVYFLNDATAFSSMPYAVIITIEDKARGIKMWVWESLCASLGKFYKKLSNEKKDID